MQHKQKKYWAHREVPAAGPETKLRSGGIIQDVPWDALEESKFKMVGLSKSELSGDRLRMVQDSACTSCSFTFTIASHMQLLGLQNANTQVLYECLWTEIENCLQQAVIHA